MHSNNLHAVIDTEFDTLDMNKAHVLEMACLLTDDTGYRELGLHQWFIRPDEGENLCVEEDALEQLTRKKYNGMSIIEIVTEHPELCKTKAEVDIELSSLIAKAGKDENPTGTGSVIQVGFNVFKDRQLLEKHFPMTFSMLNPRTFIDVMCLKAEAYTVTGVPRGTFPVHEPHHIAERDVISANLFYRAHRELMCLGVRTLNERRQMTKQHDEEDTTLAPNYPPAFLGRLHAHSVDISSTMRQSQSQPEMPVTHPHPSVHPPHHLMSSNPGYRVIASIPFGSTISSPPYIPIAHSGRVASTSTPSTSGQSSGQ